MKVNDPQHLPYSDKTTALIRKKDPMPTKPATKKISAKKSDKPPKKKLSQSEWDAKFGGLDEESPVTVAKSIGEHKSSVKTERITKPMTKTLAKKVKNAKLDVRVHGRIASTNARKFKSNIGNCTKKSYVAIAKVFGKGKTIEVAVGDLEVGYEPPRSKEYANNPRKYLLGYISTMVSKKLLTEV